MWSSPPACWAGSPPGSSTSRTSLEQAPGIVGFGLRNPDGTRQPSVGAFPSLARTVWEQLIPRSRRKYQAGWRTRPGPVDWVTGACMLVNTAILRRARGDGRGFLPLSRGGRPLPGRQSARAGGSNTTRAWRSSTYIPCKIGRSRPRCGSSPGTASCSISASTCPTGSSWGSRGSSRLEALLASAWSRARDGARTPVPGGRSAR